MPVGNPGPIVPGGTARERAVRQVIYQASRHISMGLQLIPQQEFPVLDLNFTYPGSIKAEYPLPDTGIASRQNIKWNDFSHRLEKGQVRFFMSDAAAIRRLREATNKLNIQRAAEAMALQKDYNILDTLVDGVPTDNVVTAAAPWSDPSANPEADIVAAWTKLLTESNVQVRVDADGARTSESIFVVAPAGAWGFLNQTNLINNVQQSLVGYLARSYQLEFYMTRTPGDDEFQGTWPLETSVLLGVEGELTGIHAVYDGSEPSVPLVEETRVHGAGYDYLATQWFTTGVIGDDPAEPGKSHRLARIDDVVA